MAAPPSQRYRQLSFYLEGGAAVPSLFTFGLRPEELTRREASRLTVQQTLGGAWVDAFGPGIGNITLSGHTGWRGGLLESGEDLFLDLRATVYQGWHDRRAAAVRAGTDPSAVTLTFTDSLDSIRSVVVPVAFTLRRSRSRPLLMMYQIELMELGSADSALSLLDSITSALNNPLRWLAGITGLSGAVGSLQSAFATVMNAVGGLRAAVGTFLNTGTTLMQAVGSMAGDLRGQFSGGAAGLLSIGTEYVQAGANAFGALAADPTLSVPDRITLMTARSDLNDAACAMSTAFTLIDNFADLDALRGASGCSSTTGGEPISPFVAAAANPFDSLFAGASPAASISADAQAALLALQADPITLIGQGPAIGSAMARAAAGVALAA